MPKCRRQVELALILSALAVLAFAQGGASAQGGLSLPAWLESYPGATPTVRSSDALAESSYVVDAQPAEVVAHYRKLFEAQGLAFQPNPDGMGTSIRAEAKECDLLILIRSRAEGTLAKVTCAAQVGSSAAAPVGNIEVITGVTKKKDSSEWAERVRQYQEKFPPIKFNKVKRDMPAPPLVWPEWLTHVRGAPLKAKSGIDPAHHEYLTERYTTNVPMTEIYDFYRNLLTSHDYRPKAEIATGHTISGIQQNALGHVEGYNYPDGFPGAYTTIEVSMDRDVLNGPIAVSMRFTTFDYSVKRGY